MALGIRATIIPGPSSIATRKDGMHITLQVPDDFRNLPTQKQESIKKGIEARLQTEFEMHHLEELKRKRIYSPENEKILQNAINMAKADIAKGVSRKESFQQLDRVMQKIGDQLNENPKYQEFLKEIEELDQQHN